MGKELFDNIPSKVADLLSDVKNGRIGLPDLQRPFVWKDNKVRELLDSMMKGYPIGYIMLWASPDDYENTGYIGKNDKMYKRPDDLVIDGQQRLTALLAAMYGVTIKDKYYKERKIRISFNPLTREFAVWTQAYERNPEWISEIGSVFAADKEHNISKFRKAYVAAINVLGTPMLFSTAPLSQYFVLGTSGDKNSVDKHHIFPKHYLEEIGYVNDRDRNQIANFTYLDYATNIDISNAPPAEYVGRYRDKLGEDGYKAEFSPYLKGLRALLRVDSIRKISDAKNDNDKSGG